MGLKMITHGSLRNSANLGIGTSLLETHTASNGQRLFTLVGSYQQGTGELEVYRNGVYQTINSDYTEDSSNTVSFIDPLELNETVTFRVNEVRNQSFFQTVVAAAGQRVFKLSGDYRKGQNSLQVFDNGILKSINDDYVEVDKNTVELTYDAAANAKFTFRDSL